MGRRDAIRAIAAFAPRSSLQENVAGYLKDRDNDVRAEAAKTLATWSKIPTAHDEVVRRLTRACNDPELDEKDFYLHRPGWDYAYDGLVAAVMPEDG